MDESGESRGWTLHDAAEAGNEAKVLQLLSDGADVNERDNYGNTPLYYAIMNGHADVANSLLDQGAGTADPKDKDGWTPLHEAMVNGHCDVADALLTQRVDIRANDTHGNTPLLLAKDAADDVISNDENALFDVANAKSSSLFVVTDGHADVSEALFDNGSDDCAKNINGWTLLHSASCKGDLDTVMAQLAAGSDTNHKDKDRRTPLHYASRNGHANVAEALLAERADADTTDIVGWTPLHHASRKGHVDVVNALLVKGANTNIKNNDGSTPLFWAIRNGHANVAKALLDNGSNVHVKDNDRKTPLHYAIWNGHADLAEALLANGASINVKDKYGWTPLHEASCKGRAEMAEMLLVEGAEVNAKDNNGYTSLHRASNNGHVDVAEVLLVKGCDINAKDKYGSTPLHYAIRKNHTDVAVLLANKGGVVAADHGEKIPPNASMPRVKDSAFKLLEDAPADHSTLASRPKINQNQEMTPNAADKNGSQNGGELAKDDENSNPILSKEDRMSLQILATKVLDIERALDSSRELPLSLDGHGPEVSEYFSFFVGAFERAFVAAQAISSGAVKVQLDMALETLLGGVNLVGENCGIPFAGCISIFSAIIMHRQSTKKMTTFIAFEKFFRGNSRDHRILAEQFCLQLDLSSLNESNPDKMSKLNKQKKNRIVAPIRKYLRKYHLDTIEQLSPVEEKAMSDLASLTKEVLRLHQHERHTYDALRNSKACDKASYFVYHVFGKPLISSYPDRKIGSSTQNNNFESLADASQARNRNTEIRLQQLITNMVNVNANMAEELQHLQTQFHELAVKVRSQKDVSFPSGLQAQIQISPNNQMEDVHHVGEQFKLAQLEQDIRQVQIHQERQSRVVSQMKIEHFINNRVLSCREVFDLTQQILSMACTLDGNKIEVTENGQFVFHGKEYRIGVLPTRSLFPKTRTLWKGKVDIKLEEEHKGAKSIMSWFDETGLGSLYERNKRQAIRTIFADELEVETCPPVGSQPEAHCDQDYQF